MEERPQTPTIDDTLSPASIDPVDRAALARVQAKLRSSLPEPTTAGRYVLQRRIGQGAMGVVYDGYDVTLDRRVAIKFIDDARAGSAVARDRMLREAQAMARLSHANVVQVYEAVEEDDRVFIAMEFVGAGTLRDWLDARGRREWREVVAVFRGIARGLAAAHEVGVIHRDFKPDNVLLTPKGQPKVADFGLAGLREAMPSPVASSAPRSPSADLTSTGAALGTPLYMSPEQHYRRSADARSDQFSYCVALWEALFGQRPFAGDNPTSLSASVVAGRRKPPPKRHRVPAWLVRTCERGLAVDPKDRWPSMDALLAALERGASSRSRAALIVGPTIAVVGGIAIGVWATQSEAPCGGGEAILTDAWSPTERSALPTAFDATELPYARDAARTTIEALDDYAAGWLAAYDETCRATHVRGDQSEALLDLRMTCLRRRHDDIDALVDVLLAAEPSVVERSVAAVQALPALQQCADLARGHEVATLPDDPEVRRRVEGGFRDASRSWALYSTGDYRAAATLAGEVLASARELGHAPLVARAATVAAEATGSYAEVDAAVPLFVEALRAAAEADDRREEAWALLGLAQHLGIRGGATAEAEHHLQHARGVVLGLGEPEDLQIFLGTVAGQLHYRGGRYEEAERELTATLERRVPATHIRRALLSALAAVYASRGEREAAIDVFGKLVEDTERVLGPHHPDTGTARQNHALALHDAGRRELAAQQAERAVAIQSAVFPDGHVLLADALAAHAMILSAMGQVDEARTKHEAALTMKIDLLGENHPSVGSSANNLAVLLVRVGDRVEARRYGEQARRVLESVRGPKHPSLASPLMILGELDVAEGDPEGGLLRFEQALALLQDAGLADSKLAVGRLLVAWALIEAGRDFDRAREFGTASLAAVRADPSAIAIPDALPAVEVWLSEHASPPG